jgi:zinc-ribbon domain
MSASAPLADSCTTCGTPLPDGARYCPGCGAFVDDPAGTTLRVELPPEETGPVPVSFSQAQPRWFGTAPPLLLLSVAAASFLFALGLFATGHWPYALILLGISALLLATFLELARRRPGWGFQRGPVEMRERAQSAWEAVRARTALSGEARRIQSGLVLLESERRTGLLELGTAVHEADPAGAAAARARLAELDMRETELRRQLEERVELAAERIRKARLPVQETVMVTPSGPSAPYPPPDEGNPPQPATVPEPYPPPDEGTPPQPAPVPEPQPGGDS